ncbi:YDR374C [Zygosaccharomyces parabailii]|uniref:ZYBA0S13-01816g1_1 n=1 Tax=Zygosaccharomyces bailii (strain CLIB 213 / ATCC 58445 / CBS 680 / BCRC 21525 / NBRC 1098 / NCYC 1416 / NRRL Y-2227) TaxID=1333698 RepID=A0A8J2XB06_ZYGB2|nr:YDR374C [Zygosaccharomyces parabailii]AQZ11010.1 YDR374C [Zygosaccharomyces parabailii]CDF91710.1 ZYBA0S13-01816g1_1 [Zygosaccharomyces bailii CLIB 213]CDH12321.1 uncharacterized protein ZBAI_04107 [Zygosaccharomyces bailii ISA1307]SJM87627.1 uncharacterized protein ZBIST_3816 [Zygosaccharomyces bailii]
MDWYHIERQEGRVRTIEDSFKDLETLFKDKNTAESQTPRITLNDGLYMPKFTAQIDNGAIGCLADRNYVAGVRLPYVSSALASPPELSPIHPTQHTKANPLLEPIQTTQNFQKTSNVAAVQRLMQSPTQPRSALPIMTMPTQIVENPFAPVQSQKDSWKAQHKKSSAIIPPWIHVPEYSRFFVIKSSSLEHVKKSFYNGIWSSTFYGNKRLTEAYETLPEGAKVYLLFSVNASGRFCGVAEMRSSLRDDLDTSIWGDNSRYRNAFKVRWIVVRDVHNRSLKQFLIPSNDMKPVTNSRDTQEIPPAICKSILKLFKYEQSEVQSFLDDCYS